MVMIKFTVRPGLEPVTFCRTQARSRRSKQPSYELDSYVMKVWNAKDIMEISK